MPKRNSLDIPREKILKEDEEQEQIQEKIPPQAILTKPKRQISDAQKEHLNKIRAKALEKKAEMKGDTLKAKLAKKKKKELAKKCDEYTQEKEKEKEIKKKLNPQRKKRK